MTGINESSVDINETPGSVAPKDYEFIRTRTISHIASLPTERWKPENSNNEVDIYKRSITLSENGSIQFKGIVESFSKNLPKLEEGQTITIYRDKKGRLCSLIDAELKADPIFIPL